MPSTGAAVADETLARPRKIAGSLLGEFYFLNVVGLPSALLATASVASLATPSLRPHLAAFCHQIDSRTLCLHGTPMGLCARCTGIYLGLAAAWLGMRWLSERPSMLRVLEPAALLTAGVSVLLHLAGVEVDNATRLMFGLAFGIPGGMLLWRARQWMQRRRAGVLGKCVE